MYSSLLKHYVYRRCICLLSYFVDKSCSSGVYLQCPQCKGTLASKCHMHPLISRSLPMRLALALLPSLQKKYNPVAGKHFLRYSLLLIFAVCVSFCMRNVYLTLPCEIYAGSFHCKVSILHFSGSRVANETSSWHGYLYAIQYCTGTFTIQHFQHLQSLMFM